MKNSQSHDEVKSGRMKFMEMMMNLMGIDLPEVKSSIIFLLINDNKPAIKS